MKYYLSDDSSEASAVDRLSLPLSSFPRRRLLRLGSCRLGPWQSAAAQQWAMAAVMLILLGFKIWGLVVDVLVMSLTATDAKRNGGDYLLDENLKIFSFPELVRDFWRSGAWFASILIAAGSAVLPLSKGVLLLFSWHTPLLSYRRRGQVIGLLHHFGRYVFIDVFFSCFIISVFFVEMTFGDLHVFVSTRVCVPYVIGVTCNVAVNVIGE